MKGGRLIDIVIFRYCKDSSLGNTVIYNDEEFVLVNNNGLVTFSKGVSFNVSNWRLFNVTVGLVNGREEVYRHKELGNIEVLNDEDKIEKILSMLIIFQVKIKT